MATSTIDGTVEEAVLKRRRSQGGFYERIKFRLDDGTTRTWTKAHVMNNVGDLLVPGTHGRFYFFTAIDHRGVSGVRTDDGREAFGVLKVNEYVGLGIAISMTILTILYLTVLERIPVLSLILAVLGLPMYLLYRQNRLDAEKAFNADAGYRPPVLGGLMSWTWRDAGTLAQIARWGLFADALVAGVAVALSVGMGAEEFLLGDLAGTLAIVQFVTILGSLILFLIWFYRANANVRAMGADGLMGSPGLSVAWFFIPIAFLFMPFVVVRDTWKASASPRDWQGQPTEPLIGFWWAAFLASHLAGTISFRLAMEGDYDMLGAIVTFDLISNLAAIPAALLGALLVTRIQALQASPAHLSEHFR